MRFRSGGHQAVEPVERLCLAIRRRTGARCVVHWPRCWLKTVLQCTFVGFHCTFELPHFVNRAPQSKPSGGVVGVGQSTRGPEIAHGLGLTLRDDSPEPLYLSQSESCWRGRSSHGSNRRLSTLVVVFDFIANALGRKSRSKGHSRPKRAVSRPVRETVKPPLEDVASMVVRPKFSGNVTGHLDSTLRRITQEVTHAGDRLVLSRLFRAVRNEGVSLPVMPDNVLKIQRMLNDSDCSVASVAQAISTEPMVAAKFITVANSPMYSAACPITALEDAIVRVGLNQASTIVLAIVARSRLFKAAHFQQEADALYMHSLACGATCQALAPLVRGVRADDAFTAGLLQELGRVFVLSLGDGVAREHPKSLPQWETMVWFAEELDGGFSALVAESWGYQETLVRALELHNHVGRMPGEDAVLSPDDPDRLTYLVAASDLMARASVRGVEAVDSELLARLLSAVGLRLDDRLLLDVECTVAPLLADLGGPTCPTGPNGPTGSNGRR